MIAKSVYLDWAATAPLAGAAIAAMTDAMTDLAAGRYANPSSQHAPGRTARRALGNARAGLAAWAGVSPDDIIFTSGGTEALALALGGADCSARVVGATEHAAVRLAAPDAAVAPVDANGVLRLDVLDAMLADTPAGALVAVAQANNETGVVQDIAAIAAVVHAHDGRLLVDAVQAAGKLPLPRAADFIALSAHKLGGPMGVGALIVRCRDGFAAVRPGGGQESGYRGGTENLPGILGFAAAVTAQNPDWTDRCAMLRQGLEGAVVSAGAHINGAGTTRLPTISSIHLPGIPAATQLMALDLAGIAVSQGSACSSGTLKPSETLIAMGLHAAAGESLRVSMGWNTTGADIDRFLEAWMPLAERRRAA
ncbi:MAG: aminotransferase class V-fold PLP-dependent enzyme [Sphingomonadaceae bacterium]